MEAPQTIKIIINQDTKQEREIEIDERLLDYNLEFINRDLIQDKDNPIIIPKQVKPFVFDVIKEFIKLQNYTPQPVIKKKPITSDKFKEQVTDEKYYQFFKQYSDLNNSQKATELLEFANYSKFQVLYDAIGAAIAVNYYVGNTQAQIKQFMEKNRLDKLTPSQISQIMDEHAEIFQRIQQKSKQEMMNAENN